MPYLDIAFHNIQSRPKIYTESGPQLYYELPTKVNVFQGPGRAYGAGYGKPASVAWGPSISSGSGPAGIFICESPPYEHYGQEKGWSPPKLPQGVVKAGLTPFHALNKLCAFFDGTTPAYPRYRLSPPHQNCFGGEGGIWCLGTGSGDNQPPPGSDRYAIEFCAAWNYPGTTTPVAGVFAHVKNTGADPGTQVAALCRKYPHHIVFGDLNLDAWREMALISLTASVEGTHVPLILLTADGRTPYLTHCRARHFTSTLDYALIPRAAAEHVELWAWHNGGAAETLWTNGSDHSAMMLRIHCQ